jgi:hypothetical protein
MTYPKKKLLSGFSLFDPPFFLRLIFIVFISYHEDVAISQTCLETADQPGSVRTCGHWCLNYVVRGMV